MTQSPNPQLPHLPEPETKLGKVTKSLLSNILEPLDLAGRAVMGELWRDFYLTVQDAIALSLLLRIPGLIGHWIIGKDFSSFEACAKENFLSVTPYACFIIVISDFFLWIFLGGRIVGRFWAGLSEFKRTKKGKANGSNSS